MTSRELGEDHEMRNVQASVEGLADFLFDRRWQRLTISQT